MNRLAGRRAQPFVAVAGLSARMLAQSARLAGLRVAALDIFGDRDTRAAAELWFDIGGNGLSISKSKLVAALERVARLPQMLGWIGGGGIEPLVGELDGLPGLPPRLGNSAQTSAAVRDPRRFAALLDAFGVPHPQVRFAPPASAEDAQGWLRKLVHGCGGTHIEPAAQHVAGEPAGVAHAQAHAHAQAPANEAYFQRLHAGRPMSALFVASGGHATIVGFAEQLVCTYGELRYVHAGSIGPVAPPARVAAALARALDAICSATGLVGVNSCDFLLDGDAFAVLEINARPSATMALYEAALPRVWPHGLLAAHLDACLRHTPPPGAIAVAETERPLCCAGQRVLFAPHAFVVSDALSDACSADPGCRDIPCAGATIDAGQPVCTVVASAPTADAARRALDAQRDLVLQRIDLCDPPDHATLRYASGR